MAGLYNLCFMWILFGVCCVSINGQDLLTTTCPSTKSANSGVNIAYLTVDTANINSSVVLQLISKECYGCELQDASHIPADNSNCSVILDTRWPVYMAVTNKSNVDVFDESCSESMYRFKENGNYLLSVVERNSKVLCKGPYLMNDPNDSNIAFYATVGILVAVALVWIIVVKLVAGTNSVPEDDYNENTLGPQRNFVEPDSKKKERLKSLDTFRGISLVIMMFVNYGGANYWYFSHSKWNGLTVADLVFPWFIWIMGTAMSFSFNSLAKQNVGKGKIFQKIVGRSLMLFLLGFLVSSSSNKNFKKWRLLGVLQRFSLTYILTASIHLCFMINARVPIGIVFGKWKFIRDITNYWGEWVIQMSLVVVHTCLTFLLPVPGCPTGYLGPGGLSDKGHYSNCTGGASRYIDKKIIGDHLMYKHPTCAEIYRTTVPYEPEGILGTLTSTFLCFLGLQAGKILLTYPTPIARIKRFLIWSVFLGSLSLLLCKASKNDGWIPINKNLWSLSYVLAMASMAFILLTVCYLATDVFKIWTGAPFYYPGMNSIVVYVCHEFFSGPFRKFWVIEPHSHAVFMLINIWDISVWIVLSIYLYYKQIFISV